MIESRPKRRADLAYEELPEENELMLVDERAGQVQVLNATAGGLWLLCDGRRDLDDLTGILCGMFPKLSRDEVRGQVEEGIRFLEGKGLVE
ncbi:MAG: PqqD family protein [Deltaproteobacteria bacterium]|nr:PqqD family protein [Deltaproteobacteria bacterium]